MQLHQTTSGLLREVGCRASRPTSLRKVDGEVQVRKLRVRRVDLTLGRYLRVEGRWGYEGSEAQWVLFKIEFKREFAGKLQIMGRSSVTVGRGCCN
jgi:hypothetical protein